MWGSRPCHRAWFVSSVVGFIPELKGRGIRLAISMKHEAILPDSLSINS